MDLSPSHRNPNDLQPEVCELCGMLIGHEHLVDADVEGLRGFRICDSHQFERRARVTPSWRDIQAMSTPPEAPDAGQRLPPTGGADFTASGINGAWMREGGDGFWLREDGGYWLKES